MREPPTETPHDDTRENKCLEECFTVKQELFKCGGKQSEMQTRRPFHVDLERAVHQKVGLH